MKILAKSISIFAVVIASLFNVQAMAQDKVEITVESNDRMQFNVNEIKVEAGQTVVLNFKHTGRLPEAAMGHNIVILAQGTDIPKFAAEAAKARANEFVPVDSKEVIAATELIGGGEETTIEFVAPEAGTYDFICSFPGHYGMMKGKFIVSEKKVS